MNSNIRLIYISIFILLILLIIPRITVAQTSNNKFGMHLAQPNFEDIKKTAELVNSNNGDWGYVTLVIQENDRDRQKWQDIFDLLRENHLIPIIRLATKPEGENWRRPEKNEAEGWVNFLNSLNWVVKNRYIVLFNEPNHGAEWGGEVNAVNYAEVSFEFAKKLKEKDPDFFIMMAGLDASAPSYGETMEDEEVFMQKISNYKFPSFVKTSEGKQIPNKEQSISLLNIIDGWVSHSYPNPGFSGNPWDAGRKSISGYKWELNLLKNLGVEKKLPVFITETGWKRSSFLSEFIIQNYIRSAYENIWLPDNDVIAVTPFVFDYQSDPFLGFSWKKPQSNEYFSQYYTVQDMTKIRGEPEIIERGDISADLPKNLVERSSYHFKIKLNNTGQAVWDKGNDYKLQITNDTKEKLEYIFSDIKSIKPFKDKEVDLYLKTKGISGQKKAVISLVKNDTEILKTKQWIFDVLPLPSLEFKIGLFPKFITNGPDFELQIFDNGENLVYKSQGLTVKAGRGVVYDIQNIVLDKKYRVVILKPYYLPRQILLKFKTGKNSVKFENMLPIDFDKNGKFDGGDITSFFGNLKMSSLFIP